MKEDKLCMQLLLNYISFVEGGSSLLWRRDKTIQQNTTIDLQKRTEFYEGIINFFLNSSYVPVERKNIFQFLWCSFETRLDRQNTWRTSDIIERLQRPHNLVHCRPYLRHHRRASEGEIQRSQHLPLGHNGDPPVEHL